MLYETDITGWIRSDLLRNCEEKEVRAAVVSIFRLVATA